MQLHSFFLREVSKFQANGPDVNLHNTDLHFFLLTAITTQNPFHTGLQNPFKPAKFARVRSIICDLLFFITFADVLLIISHALWSFRVVDAATSYTESVF